MSKLKALQAVQNRQGFDILKKFISKKELNEVHENFIEKLHDTGKYDISLQVAIFQSYFESIDEVHAALKYVETHRGNSLIQNIKEAIKHVLSFKDMERSVKKQMKALRLIPMDISEDETSNVSGDEAPDMSEEDDAIADILTNLHNTGKVDAEANLTEEKEEASLEKWIHVLYSANEFEDLNELHSPYATLKQLIAICHNLRSVFFYKSQSNTPRKRDVRLDWILMVLAWKTKNSAHRVPFPPLLQNPLFVLYKLCFHRLHFDMVHSLWFKDHTIDNMIVLVKGNVFRSIKQHPKIINLKTELIHVCLDCVYWDDEHPEISLYHILYEKLKWDTSFLTGYTTKEETKEYRPLFYNLDGYGLPDARSRYSIPIITQTRDILEISKDFETIFYNKDNVNLQSILNLGT